VTDQPTLTDGTVTLRPRGDADREHAFDVEADGEVVGSVTLAELDDRTGALDYRLREGRRGRGSATRAVRVVVDWALTESDQGGLGLSRVQATVAADQEAALRVATRSGLQREGIRRDVLDTDVDGSGDQVVLARLASDPPLTEPGAFRALLNSFLPRKRAIAQMLIRDDSPEPRVLLCHLTYKQDWDLPGGVVEVGESPQAAAPREVLEELGLTVPPGPLLLTDWLPPWSGWDDALCLVFDGGVLTGVDTTTLTVQAREIQRAEFCTMDQVAERCADFTARRIASALASLEAGGGPAYVESGGPGER
jgi:RimJ/RimL family protein N-acetyltransferase/8-oxo-dGTP pyrophosphatase MutT (NUDIX family)